MADPISLLGPAIQQAVAGLRPPTAIPDITDEVVIRAQFERKRRLAAMQGRGATFLTGPRGLGGPSSEIANAFLRAALQPPAPWPATFGPHTTRPAPAPLSPLDQLDPGFGSL